MPPKFQIIEVPANVPREQEQIGTKFKFWYEDSKHGYCLIKEGHPKTGEDWAERVAAELCELLEMPHSIYKLAVRAFRHLWKRNRHKAFVADCCLSSGIYPQDQSHGSKSLKVLVSKK